jgi:glycosyltransferase involved in cell wall biosynthesis
MYPGPDAPDLGVFVANLERELVARGHEIERAVVNARGGRSRHAVLFRDAIREARRFRPEVAYAHFLVPAGLAAALATRAPLVVTAHGQDVENVGAVPAVRAATRYVVRRAAGVIAVSRWLRDRLEERVPDARGKTEVIDCGVDLERFAPRDSAAAAAELGWDSAGTRFVCLGGLTER